ncbi:MAG: S49 family peptidase [Enhydrobacter sp.]|nr:S49 family peptidase [Enhydrobacter sp.]
MRYAHLARRAFGRPLLLEPRQGAVWLDSFARVLQGRQDLGVAPPRFSAMEDDGSERRPVYASLPVGLVERDYRKAFAQYRNVAVLQVDGTLVNNLGTVDPWCGMTGYDGLRTQLAAAMNDSSVKGIALVCDSPGGEVAGCFDLADQVRAAREDKPVWAIVDSMACSAAFALAVGAGRITCSSVGYTGSVGVICAHWDLSAALAEAGVKVTMIYAGEHKADGNEYEPLPEAVRAQFQKEIDAIAGLFFEVVARGRGIGVEAVQATQANSYLPDDALKRKFCDDILSPTEALLELAELTA